MFERYDIDDIGTEGCCRHQVRDSFVRSGRERCQGMCRQGTNLEKLPAPQCGRGRRAGCANPNPHQRSHLPWTNALAASGHSPIAHEREWFPSPADIRSTKRLAEGPR